MTFVVILLVLGAAAGVAAIGFGIYRGKKAETDQAWHRAANQLGLEFIPGQMFRSRCIGGYLGDHRVRVDTFSKNSGNHSTTYTRYRVYYPRRLGLRLKLTRQKFMNSLASFFGAQDIEVGDKVFDEDVIVKGGAEDRVREFLTAGRREVILGLFDAFDALVIEDDCVRFSPRGVAKQPEVIVTNLRDLAKAVSRLDLASARMPPRSRVVDPRHVELHEAPEADLDEPAVEIEIAERQQAVPMQEVKEAQVAREIQETPAVPTTSLEVAEVCHALFSSELSSNESQRRFKRDYSGQVVRWSGVVQQAQPYSIDLVFGGDSGTRALLVIHELSGPLSEEARAAVRLPLEAADSLSLRIGTRIGFEGRLISCDPMARTLFVTDAALV